MPLTKYTSPLATLLPFIQNANISDHGIEKHNGQNLRHITVTLGSDAFDVLAELGVVGRVLNVKTDQELTRLDNAVLNVWIDQATSYVHSITLKTDTSFDTSGLGRDRLTPPSPTTEKVEKYLTLDYSQFNQITAIPTPVNVAPAPSVAGEVPPKRCPFQRITVINGD